VLTLAHRPKLRAMRDIETMDAVRAELSSRRLYRLAVTGPAPGGSRIHTRPPKP
jgi:hypothetical protein